MFHLMVGDGGRSNGLQCINPIVTDAIGELLFLSPGNTLRQHILKSFAHNALLHFFARTHLDGRAEVHCHIQELFIEEGNTTFHTPGRKALIGTQTVVQVQFGELTDRLFVKSLWCGGFVEVEITTENLIGTFATKHHLDAHRLDDTCQQVHRCGSTNSGNVVCFDKVDDITQGIEPFLNGIIDFMVNSADIFRHFTGFNQVRCTAQTDGEGVELRPPGFALVVGFNALAGIFLGNGGDDGRVEATTEQNTVRNIGH